MTEVTQNRPVAASTKPQTKASIRALEASNFFLADVQTGLGPFLAAYLASAGWKATLDGKTIPLANIPESQVWEGSFIKDELPAEGIHDLSVTMEDASGGTAEDLIRCVLGKDAYKAAKREQRDQDNAFEAWPERGLLGTQLGPNKNGRKW